RARHERAKALRQKEPAMSRGLRRPVKTPLVPPCPARLASPGKIEFLDTRLGRQSQMGRNLAVAEDRELPELGVRGQILRQVKRKIVNPNGFGRLDVLVGNRIGQIGHDGFSGLYQAVGKASIVSRLPGF